MSSTRGLPLLAMTVAALLAFGLLVGACDASAGGGAADTTETDADVVTGDVGGTDVDTSPTADAETDAPVTDDATSSKPDTVDAPDVSPVSDSLELEETIDDAVMTVDDTSASDVPDGVDEDPGPSVPPDTLDPDIPDLHPAPDLALLVKEGGCSDLAMTLGSDAGDLNLVFTYHEDLAKTAYEADTKTATVTLDLASEGNLALWQGNQVTFLTCNDAFNGTEVVQTTWTAVSGTAVVTVDSLGEHEPWDAYPGTGTLTLTNVLLTAPGAEDVVIPTLTWSAAIGWLPG